jgi:lipopolysaccharide export system permease protein
VLRRYLFREVLAPFLGWVGLLCVIFFIMSFLRGTEFLLGSAATASDLARFTVALVPQFVVQATPIALLLAILVGLGRLSEDREIMAMQSLGVSPFDFVRGPLFLGVVLSGGLALLSCTLQPWGMRSLRQIAQDIIRRNVVSDVREGVFHEGLSGFTLYTERVEANQQWKNVFVFDGRDEETPLLAFAQRGVVEPSTRLDTIALVLQEGSLHQARRDHEEYATVDFSSASFRVDLSDAFFRKNEFRSVREESSPLEVWRARREAVKRNEDPLRYEIALHWRLGQALMPLAFAWVGTPLALSRRRSGRAFSFFFTIAAYLVFYLTWRTAEQFAERQQFPAFLAGQLPNIVFALCGVGLLYRVARRGAA